SRRPEARSAARGAGGGNPPSSRRRSEISRTLPLPVRNSSASPPSLEAGRPFASVAGVAGQSRHRYGQTGKRRGPSRHAGKGKSMASSPPKGRRVSAVFHLMYSSTSDDGH